MPCLGKMVRGKTYSAIHRGEKRHRVPREEWIVVSGTHEPIISQELYDKVQAVNEERTREHEKNLQKNKKNCKKGLTEMDGRGIIYKLTLERRTKSAAEESKEAP